MRTPQRRLAWTIVVATLARVALNTARRFAYPFAPALSRGLGVPLPAITSIIALNQGTGLLGLIFGPLADQWGYRRMLLLALSVLIGGMLAGGLFPFYIVVLGALCLAGAGKTMFDPAIQAYVSSQVPYQRRGLVIGIIEIGWAGSSLLGIPLMGLLINRFGWRAPFFVLPAFGVLTLIGLYLLLPQKHPSLGQHCRRVNIWSSWRQLVSERTAIGMLWCGFFVNAANDAFFVVYGSWLESKFGLSLVALGMSTTVIGIAELTGEGFTALFADRLGLRKSVILGVSLSGLSYLGLLWWGHTLSLALFALFFIFLTIEFTIVCSLSLSTELLPDARATMLAGYLAAAATGRVVGALIGGPIWLAGGILATGITAAVLNGLGLVCLYWGTLTNAPSDL